MPTQKFLRESQERTYQAIETLGEVSAYDVMDVVAAGLEGNRAFAMRQRVSGACSELHAEGRIVKVGRKVNPSSGETVNVYRANPEGTSCSCGNCPGDGADGEGAGYKSKYEALLEKYQALLAERVPLCRDCCTILCRSCTTNRNRATLVAVA
jgi:hypothetical protein